MQAYLFPKISSAVISTEPAIDSLNSLQKFQMQLYEASDSPLVNFRVNKRHIRANTFSNEESEMASGIKKVSREINDLKK
jgi:hypothetical protein